MSLAKDLYPHQSPVAKKHDLDRIEWTVNVVQGAQSLSRVARSWLSWYLALVRIGYEQIRAPMGAITDAQHRSCGHTASERSAYRAHAELEQHGYITRRQFRGGDRLSVIDINRDRYKFWLQQEKKEDKDLHLPKCQTSKLTSTPSMLHTTDLESTKSNSSKSNFNAKTNADKSCGTADVRPKKTDQSAKYDSWRHPVLYSVCQVLIGAGASDAKIIEQAARSALERSDGRINPAYTWAYWQQLPISQREYLAKHEIIPALRVETVQPDRRLDDLIGVICGRTESNSAARAAGTCEEASQSGDGIASPADRGSALDEEEMAVLRSAKKRAEKKIKII